MIIPIADYLYLKQTHKNEPAVLQVDVSNNDQDSACISFQVSGYSGLRRPLQLIQMLDSSRETIIWSLESFHLFTWIPVQIQVPLSQVNSIQLRSYQSAVGIRQLTASLEHCQLPLYSFEIDEVELSQNANQTEPHFEIIQASDAIDSKLPTIDVTLKSSQGHYIVSRRPSLSNQSAIWALRKPILSPQSTRYALRADCLHFNLFQSNENSEYLNVVATYNRFGTAPTRQQTLWSSKGLVFSPLVTWNHVKLQVQAVDKTLIEFHAIPLNRESHPIGLDDIQVESGPCSTLWINCRFDRDTCDFQAVEQDVQFKVGPLQLADEHLLSLPVPSSLYLESMLYADFTEFDLDSTEAGPSTDSFAIASGGRTLRLIQSPLPPTVTGMLWIQCQVLILSSPQSEFEFSLHFLSPDHVEPLKLISYNQVTPNWTDVEFMVFSQSSWQTMIEAKVDSAGHLPLIAVRNFQFKVATRSDLEEQRKVPNDAITCDFLTDFCGWRNTGNGTFVLAAYSHARLPHYDLFHGNKRTNAA